ncbi:hypothetical protein RHSIM_RhsimUnG0090400 [Rhododendron simsii]|uniref:Cytochrome P450 n=1 Tax=Rhododendron simsii TaxID=118357 RepID=A0A834FV36_RHOSS|nr:hypothetical protein RHSIM_RhsimUnG0090400 [Rhododendron simsii]
MSRPEAQLMGYSRIAVLIPSSFSKSSSFRRHVFSHFILLCKEASRKSSLPKPSDIQRSIDCQQDIAQPKKVTTTCVTLYLPFGGGPRKCVGDMFASFEIIVAVAMLVRRFNFEVALGAPRVQMTTGATIHTTEGLNMRVTRRIKPPIIPELEMPVLNGNSGGLSVVEPELAQRGNPK